MVADGVQNRIQTRSCTGDSSQVLRFNTERWVKILVEQFREKLKELGVSPEPFRPIEVLSGIRSNHRIYTKILPQR